MKHSFWVKFSGTLNQLAGMHTLKALRIHNGKEHHHLFSSNSTPLA